MQGLHEARPAGRETRQSTDQVQHCNLFGRIGVVRQCPESSGSPCSEVIRLRCPGRLIRVLPLDDTVTDHRPGSPSRPTTSQCPAPAGDICAARQGPVDAPCAIRGIRPAGCRPYWRLLLNNSDTAAGRPGRRAGHWHCR